MSALSKIIVVVLPLCVAVQGVAAPQPKADHPKNIVYPKLDFKLPPASQFREVLSNGMVVFIAEDRMLPTFDLSITLRTGSAVEPVDKTGLASLTG